MHPSTGCALQDPSAVLALLGEEEWEDLLKEMKLIAVENIQIEGDTATAEVTAEVLGERETETDRYVREDGRWRLAPDPEWGENFTQGDVPAGEYVVKARVNEQVYAVQVTVEAGNTALVMIQTGDQGLAK